MDDLVTLIRLAKLDLDEKRKALAVLQERDDQLQAQHSKIEQNIAQESKANISLEEGGHSFAAFLQASRDQQKRITQQRQQLAREIDAARDLLQLSFEELKRYELALDARLAEQKRQQQKRETQALDEIASGRAQAQQKEEK